jgi:hypothetical protein
MREKSLLVIKRQYSSVDVQGQNAPGMLPQELLMCIADYLSMEWAGVAIGSASLSTGIRIYIKIF